MGYIIVGSEDGISIVDPHSGAWAERLDGWPRNLKDNTAPALTNNDVGGVAAGFSDQPAVIDAASGLLIDVFGELGRHARSAVGVAALPRGAPVEIELVVRCS